MFSFFSAHADQTRMLRAISVLALTQIIGWGTTFQLPVLFARPMAADLGISYESVFFGVTIFALLAGLAAPRSGRLLDRWGGRPVLAAGSVLMAAGLVLLGIAQGPALFYAAWALLGLGCALGLYMNGFAALAEIAGPRARIGIGIMSLVTVSSLIVVHPLNSWMLATFGWRTPCLVYAAVHVGIGIPLHLFALPARRDGFRTVPGERDPFPPLPVERQPRAQVWFVLAFAAIGLIGWGFPLHIVTLLRDSGMDAVAAVTLAGLFGPIQAGGRLVEVLVGERHHPLVSARIAFIIAPIGFAVMLFAPPSTLTAVVMVTCWGLCNGVVTLTRASLPLVLFGREGFGHRLGQLVLPQNIVFSLAPILFAALLERGGPHFLLATALGVSLAALVALLTLVRIADVKPPRVPCD